MSSIFQCKNINDNLVQKKNLHQMITARVKHTERFFLLIQQKSTELFKEYMQELQQKLQPLINPNFLLNSIPKLNIEFEPHSILKTNDTFLSNMQNAILSTMQIQKYEGSYTDVQEINLNFRDYYRGIFIFEYTIAQTLCEMIPRHEALELIKEYARGYYLPSDDESQKKKSLKDYADSIADGAAKTHQTLNYLEGGRFLHKVERCLYAEAISDLPDKELVYYLECYGDYFNHAKVNENFVLTRTRTLMKGDSCCDFCWHDKRYIEEIYHPSDIDWKNMERQLA